MYHIVLVARISLMGQSRGINTSAGISAEAWKFVKPALSPKELKYSRNAIFFVSIFFFLGAAFFLGGLLNLIFLILINMHQR